MTTKNYGPAVSGYLDPTGRNWENPVFQAGKPVLDKELNLVEDLSSGFGQGALRRAMPSGWISDDFTTTSNPSAAVYLSSIVPDQLSLPNALTAHVNGWLLNIAYTNSSTNNVLALPPGPLVVGSSRTDFVVLEVWRRLVSATTPDGKSPLGRIWLNGNVKIAPADDAALNPVNDILDVAVGSETTKRVQIQYRLRVISGVDLFAYPYAMNDPSVLANSVPPNAATPDGVGTAFQYVNQSANGDAGLWVAGDGNPANALGTVDGYMYAVPLLAVFRRNQSAFDKDTNHNGGVASPGPSDRPDGLFYDIVAARDVADLRTGVSPTGWNYPEILAKNVGYLLDNTIQTEWTKTLIGGGYSGHTVLTADEIGPFDTPGANLIGRLDGVRRFFSDRPITEIVTVAIDAPPGGWVGGDVVTINPTSLPVYPFLAYNWDNSSPNDTTFIDITRAYWTGEALGKVTLDASPHIKTVTGLGAQPIVPVTVTMAAAPAPGVTDERLFVDVVVSYPSGQGLVNTPTQGYSVRLNNPALLPVGSLLVNTNFDLPHREVQAQYTQPALDIKLAADNGVVGATSFVLPERAASLSSVLKNGVPIAGAAILQPDGRTVVFTVETTNPGDLLRVIYVPLRPLPEAGTGVELTIWYEARAPQTGREAILPGALTVVPRCIDSAVYTLTTGPGSLDEAYPYPVASTQLGGIPSTATPFYGDHELAASSIIYTSEFNASTGMLRLPAYIGYVPNPQEAVFNRMAGDVDAEGRTFFPTVPGGAYVPNAYGQPLTDSKRHRNFLPVLAELAADSTFGFKGQLVLVMLIREALFDKTNGVAFDPTPANTTVASVYRIKGNLLSKRA